MSQNKKSGSLLGTIITVYILFLVLTSFLNIGGPQRNFSGVIIVVVAIAIVFRVITQIKKSGTGKEYFTGKQPTQYRKTANQSGNSIGEKGFNKDFGLNEIKNLRQSSDREFIKIDPKDHYHQQYKELYDAGIITKEELSDRIAKRTRY